MTRNEKSGAAALPVPPVTGTSADMLFRKAGPGDCARAQEIIRLARERMGRQGNPQWQDGYPADEDVRHDIEAGNGYVLCLHNRPVVYGAILFDEDPHTGRSRAGGSTTGLMRSYTGSPYTKRSSERDWPDCSCSRPSGCVSTDTYSTYGRIPIPPTDLCAACWSARAMFSAERYGTENLPVVHTKKSSAKARKKAAERT